MKDQTDTQTTELFPLAEPKRRGRPLTGKAKTAAQRQADYRRRKYYKGGTDNLGHKHVDWWLDYRRFQELDALAFRAGKTPLEMVSDLIQQAHAQALKSMTMYEQWDFMDKKSHVTENPKE